MEELLDCDAKAATRVTRVRQPRTKGASNYKFRQVRRGRQTRTDFELHGSRTQRAAGGIRALPAVMILTRSRGAPRSERPERSKANLLTRSWLVRESYQTMRGHTGPYRPGQSGLFPVFLLLSCSAFAAVRFLLLFSLSVVAIAVARFVYVATSFTFSLFSFSFLLSLLLFPRCLF